MDKLHKPLVSICIPTYNRAIYLAKSIDSIIKQYEFLSGQVEIVISDNASSDNTKKIVERYLEEFDNVLYFCNSKNIKDKNFAMVLSRGNGILRKLSNDTVIYCNGSLQYLCKLAIKYSDTKPILFFPNKRCRFFEYRDNGIESLLWHESYNITWIGAFSIWDSDCNNIKSDLEICETQLWQVWELCNLLAKSREVVILPKRFGTTQYMVNKDISYGLYKIFYKNYFEILNYFMIQGFISCECIKWLKKDLLFNFFTFWIIKWEEKNSGYQYSENENLKEVILKEYENEKYYSVYMLFYKLSQIRYRLESCIKNIICIK